MLTFEEFAKKCTKGTKLHFTDPFNDNKEFEIKIIKLKDWGLYMEDWLLCFEMHSLDGTYNSTELVGLNYFYANLYMTGNAVFME